MGASAAKIAANRKNATKSTGPTTIAGKRSSALNATRHAVLSVVPVLPGVESTEEWASHHTGTLASLSPSGYLETILADRVASLLWRLGRVTRYETENTASTQENAWWTKGLGARTETNVRPQLLLPLAALEKMVRYETHIERSLYKALHELQRLQAIRNGTGGAPMAFDVDVSLRRHVGEGETYDTTGEATEP